MSIADKGIVGALVLLFTCIIFAEEEEQFPSGKMCTAFRMCDEKATEGKVLTHISVMVERMPDFCSYKCNEMKAMTEGQTLPCRFAEDCIILKQGEYWYLRGTCPALGTQECYDKAYKKQGEEEKKRQEDEKQREKKKKKREEEKKNEEKNENDGTNAGHKGELKMLMPIIASMVGSVLTHFILK